MKKTLPNHGMRWSEVKRPIVCMAPMDGVTNSAYRQIVRSLNREVFLFSEFTSVDGLVQNEFLRSQMYYNPSEHPFFMHEKWMFTGIVIHLGTKKLILNQTVNTCKLTEKKDFPV